MSLPLVLRSAADRDIETLRGIDRGARSRYRALAGFAFVADAAPIAAERFAGGATIVAELDGKCVGFALSQRVDGFLYLANISVAPQSGGRGIGAALLRATEAAARQDGHAAVTLATFRAPPWNGPSFRKQGYAPMPEAGIGPALRAILDRHAAFLDVTIRETLWKGTTEPPPDQPAVSV